MPVAKVSGSPSANNPLFTCGTAGQPMPHAFRVLAVFGVRRIHGRLDEGPDGRLNAVCLSHVVTCDRCDFEAPVALEGGEA